MISDSLTVFPVATYYLLLFDDLSRAITANSRFILAFFPLSNPDTRSLHVYCNQLRVYASSVASFDAAERSIYDFAFDLRRDRAVLSRLYDAYYDEYIVHRTFYVPHFMRLRLFDLQHSVGLLLEAIASFLDHLDHCRETDPQIPF